MADPKKRKRKNKLPPLKREELRQLVRDSLAGGKWPGEIKREIASRFSVSPRSVERYITEARGEFVLASGERRENIAAQLNLILADIIKFGTPHEKIKAVDRMIALFGLRGALAGTPTTDDDDDSPAAIERARIELLGVVSEAWKRGGYSESDPSHPSADAASAHGAASPQPSAEGLSKPG